VARKEGSYRKADTTEENSSRRPTSPGGAAMEVNNVTGSEGRKAGEGRHKN